MKNQNYYIELVENYLTERCYNYKINGCHKFKDFGIVNFVEYDPMGNASEPAELIVFNERCIINKNGDNIFELD